MKGKLLRSIACLLAAGTLSIAVGCDWTGFLDDGTSNSNYKNPFESFSWGFSSTEPFTENASEAFASQGAATPEKPDPEKTVDRYILDDIGHRVAYYTDGTYEDLGRETPLNMATPAPETQYGYQAFLKESNGSGFCNFYKDLYAVANEFHASDVTPTETVTGNDGSISYLVAKVNFAKYGLTVAQAMAVWKTFFEENPLFYWSSNVVSCTDKELSVLSHADYQNGAIRANINQKIKALALDCDRYLSGTTSLTERALTVYDYLSCKLTYAYEADGVTPSDASWAHNIVGGATFGKGVCETYAQTFDYLCGLFNLECITVAGQAGEKGNAFYAHAWNYLRLDGKWYAVDATWADQDGGSTSFVMRDYFGQELGEYNATHIADRPTDDWGVAYQYALPALSAGLCPVLVGEKEGALTMAPTIEAAAASMTKPNGEYKIVLYPDTKATSKYRLMVYPGNEQNGEKIGATVFTAVTLPKVKSITFTSGVSKNYVSFLFSKATVKLQCDLIMASGINYGGVSWNYNGYKISKKTGV